MPVFFPIRQHWQRWLQCIMHGQTVSIEQCVRGLAKGVQQRQAIAASLLQLAEEDKQLISAIPLGVRQVPFETYSPYLHDGAYLLIRITGHRQPIWLSDSLQLSQVGVLKITEGSLQSNVHQMHDNLAKYESLIASMKELKQMEQLQKDQEEIVKEGPEREMKLKRFIVTLEKEIFEARSHIKALTKENEQLTIRVAALQERENTRQQLRTLQNRFKQCNEASLSEPPKRRHKRVLLNY